MIPTGIPIIDAIIFTTYRAVTLNGLGFIAIVLKFLGII